ncbi:tryptophanase [candidate division WOR-3 bacterium]|nr:tryptophanase [candidate division WOR-3 bacterium]
MARTSRAWVAAFAQTNLQPRPYRNAAVSFRPCAASDPEQRWRLMEEVGLNVFRFPAAMIPGCDLLTDSGTTTMTMKQWSQLLLGDESYGSNEGYFELKQQVVETFGPQWENRDMDQENVFLFHQGRAAEHGLFTCLSGLLDARGKAAEAEPYYIVPSNGHFDTTQANVEANGFQARNLFSTELEARDESARFKGNMNLGRLQDLLDDAELRQRVPLVYMTITNNTGGGQPVSLTNIRAAAELCHSRGVPLLFDACRFAENAWFNQQHEPLCRNRSISEIVRLMFESVDGFHISLKKDGLVNIGGCLVLSEDGLLVERYPRLPALLVEHQILVEGHPTYGGLAGRDLKGVVEGLKTVVHENYLASRIGQVQRFGAAIDARCGASVVAKPVGGHAVYLDLDRFFADTGLGDASFPGVSLTALLLVAGHRMCELGVYAFGKQVKGEEVGPEPRVNFVRAAVPRLCYEECDLDAAAEAVGILYQRRADIPGVEVVYGQDRPMRHFISRFRFR